ncbi:MAG: ABC transporter permease [Gemmatimonadota bacterium]|nr:ABC transporter permease [Gemmatimonadota bacterium]
MGEWLELAGDAWREIRAHPLRSLLTLSGIVFGAASLVSMTSLAAGLREMAYADLREIGLPRSFYLYDREPPGEARRAAALRHPGLRLADVEALRALPGVGAAHARVFFGDRLISGPADRRMLRVEGVDAGYIELRNLRIARGRSLAPLDGLNHARVAVIGEPVATDLFGRMDPVGRTIGIDGVPFLVIGVFQPQAIGFIPADLEWQSRRIYVPSSWISRYHRAESRVDGVLVTVRPDADFPRVMHAGVTLIRQRHQTQDFDTENEAAEVAEDLAMADGILGGWNGVMYAIAIVTLIVGGIGLFSVLLISVRERVREIGIRKALGADDSAIMRLFMAESLTLAVIGAFAGVGGGMGLIMVTKLIGAQFGKSFLIPLNVPGVVIAIGFSTLVGAAFGWYPARRAARMDPVAAIEGR